MFSARDQAKAQAQKLVDAAAAEANEIQNAHQLRLNNLRAEVREMEAQRAALIDYLGLMSRKLLNLQNEAIANDPAAEARAADNADRELETELPELHTVPTPEAALDLSPETVARAVDELRARGRCCRGGGRTRNPEPESHRPAGSGKNQEEAAARQSPQPCSRRKKRRKTQRRRLKQKNSRRQKKHLSRKRPRISRTIPPGTRTPDRSGAD